MLLALEALTVVSLQLLAVVLIHGTLCARQPYSFHIRRRHLRATMRHKPSTGCNQYCIAQATGVKTRHMIKQKTWHVAATGVGTS